MEKPYIYESVKNREFDSKEAIIVLPDIYCQTIYAKTTVEKFAEAFSKPTFMLDYFFLSTSQANDFAQDEKEEVYSLMQNFNANALPPFFKHVLEEIKISYPQIESFMVVGFCFGGLLAYVASAEKQVSMVITFYGAGALTPDYIGGMTPVDYLILKRRGDSFKIRSFFGINDASIPENDRKQIKEKFADSEIDYSDYEYNAGHAYFQEGRDSYDEGAAKESWESLRKIFNQ